jgi:hypothetical protein
MSSGLTILKRTSAGVYSVVYTDTGSDGNIIGMEEWVNDAGDTFLYWATATKLHRKRLIGTAYTNSNWSDADATVNGQAYPKTNLTSTTWHTMAIVNGALLITNKGSLAKVGWDDSYTNNAVQLYPGNVAKTIMESGVVAKVGANRLDGSDRSMIFTWDTDDQNFTDKMQLPFSGINSMVETEVSIIQFGTDGELYFFGDTAKLPVTSTPNGGLTLPWGMESYNNLALIGVGGNGAGYSGVYSYGRTKENNNFSLNLEYQLDCDYIYCIRMVGSDILVAYKSLGADTYGVKKIDTGNKASRFIYQSLDLKAPDELQRIPVWSLVTLTMAPLPANTSVEVWRKMEKTGEWLQCNTQDGSLTYDTEGGQEATFQIGDGGKYCELQVIGNCSGNSSPEVYKIQTFFN